MKTMMVDPADVVLRDNRRPRGHWWNGSAWQRIKRFSPSDEEKVEIVQLWQDLVVRLHIAGIDSTVEEGFGLAEQEVLRRSMA